VSFAGLEPARGENATRLLDAAIVTIRSLYVKAFEGSSADFSHATGFVVDAERGFIMTNRHVVDIGPSVQEAVFARSKEEVELSPVWRDPIHDVGILKFDPSKVKRAPLVDLKLNPEGAQPGVEIRVTGNDAGEKLSVLSGTIARVDRAAPEYEAYGYNDWNVFYVAAASNTSGGSSGSPVLNRRGEVVALNAGGATQAASSFFLPIHRALRALRMLQQGVDVTRGELLVQWHHEPFDEVARLGVKEETALAIRDEVKGETGMLRVRRIVKGGPLSGVLETGDVLVRVNGAVTTHFLPLEEAMDSTWTVSYAVANALGLEFGVEHVWPVPETSFSVAPAEGARAYPTGGPDSAAAPALVVFPPQTTSEGAPGVKLSKEAIVPFERNEAVPFLPLDLHSALQETFEGLAFPLTSASRPVLPTDLSWCTERAYKGSLPASELLVASLKRLVAAVQAVRSKGPGTAAALREELGMKETDPLILAVPPVMELEVVRGGEPLTLRAFATDLHGTLPNELLEVSGAILHPLSLHQRVNYELPLGQGVVIATSGYMFGNGFVNPGSVITEFNGLPTTSLDEMETAITSVPDRERFPVRYFSLGENKREVLQVLQMDRRFHAANRWTADRRRGVWTSRRCADSPGECAMSVKSTTLAQAPTDLAKRAFNALVIVEFSMPFLVDAVTGGNYIGVGLVLDEERGLIMVDRNTIPAAIGDVRITLAGSVELSGKVEFLHPHYNYAIVSYDPSHVTTDQPIAPFSLSSHTPETGEDLLFVGSTIDGEMIAHECTVTKVQRLSFPDASPPRFRAYNEETVHVDRLAHCLGGVLLRFGEDGSSGEVVAVMASYSSYESSSRPNVEIRSGLQASQVRSVLSCLQAGKEPRIASLDVEFYLTPLSMARSGLGLPDSWCSTMEGLSPRRQLVSVTRCMPGVHGAAGVLKEGDLLLAINGTPVVTFGEVDRAVEASPEAVTVTILRKGAVTDVTVVPRILPNAETTRIVAWGGAMLQDSPRSTLIRGYAPHASDRPGVYVSRWAYGSTAHKYGVRATKWITEVNGSPVTSLDEFLEAVKHVGHNQAVRLKLMSLHEHETTLTLKTDLRYWPTVEFHRGADKRSWSLTTSSPVE
jgi:S1-C subfamily serine protease